MLNLAVAIALSARAKRYPIEFEQLVEFNTMLSRVDGNHLVVIATEVGLREDTYKRVTEAILKAFPLKKVGYGRPDAPYGYCRLPSYSRAVCPGMRRRIGTARFKPDLDLLFKDETNELPT